MKLFVTVFGLLFLASCAALQGLDEPRPEAEDLPDPVERGEIRFFIMSDLNSSFGSTDYQWQVDSTVVWLPRYAPDMVLSAGDLVAGQDRSLSDDEITAMWDGFERHIADSLRSYNIPYAPAMGNHDGSNAHPDFQREREKAKAYFNQEDLDWGIDFVDQANFPFWYSFEIDDVFFLVWDATSANIPDENLSWMKEQLETDRAQEASMRIVMGHLSLYPVAVGRNRLGELLNDPDDLLEILETYDVHTYISGHNHAYYPGKRGDVDLLNSGALGSGPRQILGSPDESRHVFTIVDVWPDEGRTVYTSVDARTAEIIEKNELPRYTQGVNGYVIRRDLGMPSGFSGELFSSPIYDTAEKTHGDFNADFEDGTITVTGNVQTAHTEEITLQLGKGSLFHQDRILKKKNIRADSELTSFDFVYGDAGRFEQEQLKAGMLHVAVQLNETNYNKYKGNIVEQGKVAPHDVTTTETDWDGSHLNVSWNAERDSDGYPIHYVIQVADDQNFDSISYSFHAGAGVDQMELRGFRSLLGDRNKYLRVVASDGKHRISGPSVSLP